MTGDTAGPALASHQASCHRRPWLHRLCRWALPAAFVAGAVAVWLTASAGLGLAVVGLVLLLCPLVKGADAVEATAKLQAIVFDKTGTLTRGEPSVTDVVPFGRFSREEVLSLAASAERGSEHPLGEAIVRGAQSQGLELAQADEFEAIPGRGVEAKLRGRSVLLGNRRFMAERGVEIDDLLTKAEALEKAGRTAMFLAVDGQAAGLVAVADTLKDHSAEAVARLRKLGLKVLMITGDNRRTAEAIAKQVGIDQVLAEVLPQDKAAEVKRLQAQGLRVAMVGDGINDAPALAQADVGLAIGSGTDVAKETGQVILIKEDLRDVVTAIEVAKATMRKVKEGIWDWAREEVTRNTCLGTKAKVREKVGAFFQGLGERTDEVKQRCRTVLQAQADALSQAAARSLPQPDHVVPTLALV